MNSDIGLLSRLNPSAADPLFMHENMEFVVTLKQLRTMRSWCIAYGAATVDEKKYRSLADASFKECLRRKHAL